jgi:hypothetical protein
VSAPTSLAQNITTTTQVKMTRTGATTNAVDVSYSITGPCSAPSGGSINMPAGASSVNLPIDTETATTPATSCVITPVSPTAGSAASIQIVNPDADVTFQFATTSSDVSVAGGAISIRVNRGGGTNGAFTVPLELSGSLTAGGTLLAGNLSTGSLSFAANESFKTFTYTPPPTTPVTPALPATLVIAIGTITGGSGGQSGSGIGAPHTVTLNGPGVGCPTAETVAHDPPTGTTTVLVLQTDTVYTYKLPTPTSGKSSGIWKIADSSSSKPLGSNWYYEIHINKCKGLVQQTLGDTCYARKANATSVYSTWWFNKPAGAYNTIAKIQTAGYCYAPIDEGQWYVNIKYHYPDGCNTPAGQCGWAVQWLNYNY